MKSRRSPHILLIVENVALARDHRLQKQAASLLAHGYRVTVICRRDPRNREFGVRVRQYPAPVDAQSKLGFLWEYAYSWTMAAVLTLMVFVTDPFDAMQVSGTPDIYFTIGAPFKLLGRPLVLDQRDLSPDLYEVRYGRRGSVYRMLSWLERVSYRTADHLITVNHSLVDIACGRGGAKRESVTVVGNGPVLDRTRARRPSAELKRGGRFLCCWLGMMGPQDRVELAIQAVDHLVHGLGRTDCQFAFVGDGEEREALEQLCDRLSLRDWVFFPGWMREDDAFTYLATADLGLEPNLEEIVSPVKGMEYMAFGLPFVGFDLKETRVLAEDAAAYAPPGDIGAFAGLIDQLLADPERRVEMGRVGRRIVEERVAWDRQESSYVEVYQRLLARADVARRDGWTSRRGWLGRYAGHPEPGIEEVR